MKDMMLSTTGAAPFLGLDERTMSVTASSDPATTIAGSDDARAPGEPEHVTLAAPVRAAPPRPKALPVIAEGIPEALRACAQWVLWRYSLRGETWTKTPYQADGRTASSTAPSTWCDFSRAMNAFSAGGFDGVGFVVTADDDFVGIDLDHAVHATGEPKAAAAQLMHELASYAERTPSGAGFRVWLLGRKPTKSCKKTDFDRAGTDIEIYESGRFFTVTGQRVSAEGVGVEPLQSGLDALCARLWPQTAPEESQAARPLEYDVAGDWGDDSLLARARDAKNGEKFRRLFDEGDTSGHGGDDSAADLALCSMLAFWTGREPERMDRMFRRSGLMRDKWDEYRGVHTYGQITIAKAIENCREVFGKGAGVATLVNAALPGRVGFAFTHVGELLETPPPLRWLVDEFILPESHVLLFGDPASGKSLIAIDMAASISTGGAWNGRKTVKGPVVYIAGEGHHGIRRRLKAWAIANDAEDDLKEAPLLVSKGGAALVDPNSAAEVMAAIEAVAREHGAPALVVIDTMHRNLGGDENSPEDIAALLRVLDAIRDTYGCATLVVHHSGHSDKGRSRGSSSIRAGVDIELKLEANAAEVRTLSCPAKMKDAPKPSPVHFALRQIELPWKEEDGKPETSVVLMPTGAPAPTTRKQRMPKAIRQARLAFWDAGNGFPVSLDGWRESFYALRPTDTDEAKRKAFQRARDELERAGVLTTDAAGLCDLEGTAPWSDWNTAPIESST